MEAYLINPVTRKAGAASRRNKMAKRRYRRNTPKRNAKGRFVKGSGAVTAAPKARKHRKYKPRPVKKFKRRGGVGRRVKIAGGLKRRFRHRVRSHISNPPIVGQVVNGLITAGVLFGTLFAVGFINKQLPIPQGKFTPLLTKLGVALLAAWGVRELSRRGLIRGQNNVVVAQAAVFAPLGMSLLSTFVPAVAAQVSLAGDMGAELSGYLPQDLGMSMAPGGRGRISDYTVSAELNAELEAETESGAF
jgi:hypothetical protein